MPAPVVAGQPTRVSTNTTDSARETAEVAVPAPALATTTAVNWSPHITSAWVAPVVANARSKVMTATLNELASEHSLGTKFDISAVRTSVLVSEEIALRNTKSYDRLVTPDRLRTQVSASNLDTVWVKTRAVVASGAGYGVSPGVGVGASIGFASNVEISSLMAQQTEAMSGALPAATRQAKSMVLPVDAHGLLSLNAAPGTEWMFRGIASSTVGVNVGHSESVGIPNVTATASAGAGVSASAQAVYTKNVKVLEGGRVYVKVARQTSESLSGAVGVNAGVTINVADDIESAVGAGVIGSTLGREGDRQLNPIEEATRANVSASASVSANQTLMGQAVLDLNIPAQREAFDRIMRSGPVAAAAYINENSLGAIFSGNGHQRGTAGNVQFGSNHLLAVNTMRGTENGTIVDGGGQTQLSEATYQHNSAGALPRLFKGEERSVLVRAGSLKKGDGPEQRAVAVRLSVSDPRMHDDENAQFTRFSQAMGATLDGLPTIAPGTKGAGAYSVEIALTDSQIERFSQWDENAVRLAFASAAKEIDGSTAMPPWYDRRAFQFWVERNRTSNSPHGTQSSQQVALEYAEQYPGRSLRDDLDSSAAIDKVSKRIIETRGKPIDEWGKLLETLGRLRSHDMRSAILALRKLSGAELVGLDATVNGTHVAAKAETVTPKTLGAIVGEVMSPPN